MSVARVELEGSEPSGLAELVAGLLEQHLAREPERAAHLRPSVVVLEAPDADVAVTVRLSPGSVSVSDGVAPEAHLRVVAPSDRLLALAAAPLRAGLPDPLHRDGPRRARRRGHGSRARARDAAASSASRALHVAAVGA